MDHPERDRLDFLLSLQTDSLLDEQTGPELEFLQQLYPTGLMDELSAVQDPSGDFTYTGDYNALAWPTDLNNSPFDNDHQNPASNLNHNGGQNVLASSATLDNPSFRNYYENPRSNLAHHNSDQTALASSTTLNNPPFNSHHQDSAPTFTHTNYQSNLASASPLINLSLTNQSEHHHPARNTSAIPIPNAAHAHTQRSTSIATPGSPQAGDASGAGAAAIVPRAMPSGPHPPEADGLRFTSFETASAATDLIFRRPVKVVLDDVAEVDKNKRHHVKSIIEALKHDDYMQAPYEWRGDRNKTVPLTEIQKANWYKWQDKERKKVRLHMKMPKIDIKLECVAWEILAEILKVHRSGVKLSKQAIGSKSRKCSQRVQDALKIMRDWANVRLELINGDKISEFAGNPEGYATITFRSVRNNSNRKRGKKTADGGADGSDEGSEADGSDEEGEDGEDDEAGVTTPAVATYPSAVQDSRGASENGAIAHKFMLPKEVTKRKRKAEDAAKATKDQQKKKPVADTNTVRARGLPTLVNKHGLSSMFTGRPYNFSGTSQPEPVHHGSMAPPPTPIDDPYGLGGSFETWADDLFNGVPGRSVNSLAAGTRSTFGAFAKSDTNSPFINNPLSNNPLSNNPLSNNPLSNNPLNSNPLNANTYGGDQTLDGTQNKRHREGETHHQGRRAAAVPGAIPAQPVQTQGGMPEGGAKKKQRRT
jgi:hypothetical protein